MPVFKALSLLLVLLLCSCSNAGGTSRNSSDDPPATDKRTIQKSARDTSLEEHTEEIKKMEIESRKEYPSRFNDHIITAPPSDGQGGGGNDQQGEGINPLKKREMSTKGRGR